MSVWRRRAAACCVLLFSVHIAPLYAQPPDPLTLEYALAQAGTPVSAMLRAQAARTAALAQQAQVEAASGFSVSAEARLRRVEPSVLAEDPDHNDSRLQLIANKPLYDFGRSGAGLAAAQVQVQGQGDAYVYAAGQHRLEIMRLYFDVLLADLQFSVADEAMAIEFVRTERAGDRNELGQLSDIDLLAAQSTYQQARSRRVAAAAAQRSRRARLAEAMQTPNELSAQLVTPRIPDKPLELPTEEDLINTALINNRHLRALRAQVQAAHLGLDAARAQSRPELSGNLQLSEYNRDVGSRDRWQAELLLEVPLYTGGRVAAGVAQQQAELLRDRANLLEAEVQVRQAVRETWQEINALHVLRQAAAALQDYRDLYLDRSRALYELEVKSDLGDAMVRYSEARLARAQADFSWTLAWTRLALLTDQRAWDPLPASYSTDEHKESE